MPRITIEVKDEHEGERIQLALADPTMRALIVTVGLLLPMTDRQRRRVLAYVNDKLEEERGA